jgi:hypothetical protein
LFELGALTVSVQAVGAQMQVSVVGNLVPALQDRRNRSRVMISRMAGNVEGRLDPGFSQHVQDPTKPPRWAETGL